MSKVLVATALSMLISGCASGNAGLRGHYYWGNEVETFHPCGSKQTFWVVGDEALLQPLRYRATELSQAAGKPYRPIYVEVSAVAEGKASDGFAADYDGVYRFTAVQASTGSSPAGCQTSD